MSIVLRPYQESLFLQTRESMLQGKRSPLVVAPCGAGKTVIFSYLSQRVTSKGKHTLILVHRDELLDQVSETLKQFNVPHSFIAPNRNYDYRVPVQIASVFTVIKRLDRIKPPDFIIIDEAHHACKGSTWSKVLDYFKKAHRVGVTASPIRLSGESLGDIFDDIIIGPTVRELIDQGSLCDYKLYCPSKFDASRIHTLGGDFQKDEINKAMDKNTITGDAVREYQKLANGKRAVVFCCSIEHAQHVSSQFNASGHLAASIDGKMDKDIRKKIVSDFRIGKIKILTSVNIISEGFDLPAVEVAIMLRPTLSLGLWIQQSGRSLRTFEGKQHAIILDHAGNTERLGFPCDVHPWSLKGKIAVKKSSEPNIAVRICKNCFGAIRSGIQICSYCGHTFESKSRKVDHVEGELTEVSPNEAILKQDYRNELYQCQTREQLVEFARRKEYRNPYGYAHMILQARQKKKLQAKAIDIIEHERNLYKIRNAEKLKINLPLKID